MEGDPRRAGLKDAVQVAMAHPLVHWELLVTNTERARAFYGKVLLCRDWLKSFLVASERMSVVQKIVKTRLPIQEVKDGILGEDARFRPRRPAVIAEARIPIFH